MMMNSRSQESMPTAPATRRKFCTAYARNLQDRKLQAAPLLV